MSGDDEHKAIMRALIDLLLYWGCALFSALIAKPMLLPPLLFYLIIGGIYGNTGVVERSAMMGFFAEFSITMVFFALGFEETVDHFIEGCKRAYGIALFGGCVPFGCGWLIGVIFWPDSGWTVHLVIAMAVTAKPVSLTMMVLHSMGLLKTKAAMCIMTSAVLDDVACLILVGILVPIAVAAAGIEDEPESHGTCPMIAFPYDRTAPHISGHLHYDSIMGQALSNISLSFNTTVTALVAAALQLDIANLTHVPAYLVDIDNVTNGLDADFGILRAEDYGLTFAAVQGALKGSSDGTTQIARGDVVSTTTESRLWSTERVLREHTDLLDALDTSRQQNNATTANNNDHLLGTGVITLDVSSAGPAPSPSSHEAMTAWKVCWIIIKVIIFFLIIVFLHVVVLPHGVEDGIVGKIPFVRDFGAKHLLQVFNGSQVPLIIVTFGLAVAVMGYALGFHPAIGAYFAGLILEERYFDVDVTPSTDGGATGSVVSDNLSTQDELRTVDVGGAVLDSSQKYYGAAEQSGTWRSNGATPVAREGVPHLSATTLDEMGPAQPIHPDTMADEPQPNDPAPTDTPRNEPFPTDPASAGSQRKGDDNDDGTDGGVSPRRASRVNSVFRSYRFGGQAARDFRKMRGTGVDMDPKLAHLHGTPQNEPYVASPRMASKTPRVEDDGTEGYIAFAKSEGEDTEEAPAVIINTFDRAKETVGTAAFMWLGPCFFIHLGASLKIEGDLVAEALPKALGIFAILWTGQFVSATFGAYFLPRGFSIYQSVLVGFGMLGRAELFFVVMSVAKSARLIDEKVFFPMAVAAMMMNISLPIAISLFRSTYILHNPPDKEAEEEAAAAALAAKQAEEQEEGDDKSKDFGDATPARTLSRTNSRISRRGTGLNGFDFTADGSAIKPHATGSAVRTPRSSQGPSRQASVLTRRSSVLRE